MIVFPGTAVSAEVLRTIRNCPSCLPVVADFWVSRRARPLWSRALFLRLVDLESASGFVLYMRDSFPRRPGALSPIVPSFCHTPAVSGLSETETETLTTCEIRRLFLMVMAAGLVRSGRLILGMGLGIVSFAWSQYSNSLAFKSTYIS